MESESDLTARREFLDIQEVVSEIRHRTSRLVPQATIEAQRGTGRRPNLVPSAPPSPPPSFGLAKSDEFYTLTEAGHLLAGQIPKGPPTLRSTVGRWLIAIVRRMLFWYIPQVQAFQQATAQAVREHAEALRGIHRYQRQWHSIWQDIQRDIAGLMEEVRSVRNQIDAVKHPSHEDSAQPAKDLNALASGFDRIQRELRHLLITFQNQDQTFQDLIKSSRADELNAPVDHKSGLEADLREAANTTQQIKTLVQSQESRISLLLEEFRRRT